MEKRAKTVNVFLKESEKNFLDTIADEVGLSSASYVRMLVVRHLKQMKGRESQIEGSKKV